MIRIGQVFSTLLAGFSLAAFSLSPSAAQAACEQWNLSGKWKFSQDNGFNVNFKFLQTDKVITGEGRFESGGYVYFGYVNGGVNGDSFRFTVEWRGGAVGTYSGVIDDSGGASGRTRDRQGFEAGWQGNRAATCRVAAAETSNESAKKPKTPIPRAGDQVLDVPLEGGGSAASDAILQAANQSADLTVNMKGPGSLQAGLSGTFTVAIRNKGNVAATVELNIIFAGKLDQTGQIVANAGLACEVGHDTGINAALRCTGGQLGAGESATVVVQGRGQEAGNGMLVATLNASRSVEESNYDNNLKQLNITID